MLCRTKEKMRQHRHSRAWLGWMLINMGWLEASVINIGCARGDPYIKKVIFPHTHTPLGQKQVKILTSW